MMENTITNMDRNEVDRFRYSLRPGDKVILRDNKKPYKPIEILTVNKVTPKGIVKTTDGKQFWLPDWCERLIIRGKSGQFMTFIVPYSAELAAQIREGEE